MSGSFRVRGVLADCNSHRQKEKATLTRWLQKAAISLFRSSVDGVFFPECVRQKIHRICRRILDIYGDKIPKVALNNQTPEEIIEAVKNRIASDGTIGGAARAEIVEGLNAVLAMING